MAYHETEDQCQFGDPQQDYSSSPVPLVDVQQGDCARRDAIVNELSAHTMIRPQYNINRNQLEQLDAATDYEDSDTE